MTDSKAEKPDLNSGSTSEPAVDGARAELKKIVVEDSTWSLGKMVATALAAVTVAVVSSKLTNTMGSLILVAVLSFTSVIASEIYRVIVALTGFAAKKVAAPIIPATSEQGSSEKAPPTTPIETVTEAFRIPANGGKRGFIPSLKRHFAANPALKIIVLFTAVSLLTVGVSSYVASKVEKVENKSYTTVEQPIELPDSDRQKMIQEAVDLAVSEALSKTRAADSEQDTSTEELSSLVTQLSVDSKTLSERIAALETADDDEAFWPSANGESDRKLLQQLQTENAAMKLKIAELERQIASKP